MKNRSSRVLLGLLVAVIMSVSPLLAGITGKIAGKVVDQESGFALPAVNVIVDGTTLGAATDLNGEYFILNVPPGTYDVRSSIIGYSQVVERGVRVFADLTTTVNFNLPSETLQLDEVVEVIATRPLIQKDVTATTQIQTGESINALPVTTVNAAISTAAGTQGTGNNLHVRGGRAGETAVLVDGISVKDPQANTIGLQLGRSSLSELQVISGGFNAEFGDAQSGIILLNTQEGRQERYRGSLLYQTDHFGDNGISNSSQKFDWFEGTLSGPEPITTHLLPAIGVKVPAMTFFLQGESRLSDWAAFHDGAMADLNANSAIPESPALRTSNNLRSESIFGSLFGIDDNRESVLQNWNAKLVWQLAANQKLTFGWRGNRDQWNNWTFRFGRTAEEIVRTAHQLNISDRIDQDNDGRIDEEALNGRDDDGDGRIDEDGQLAPNYYLGDFAWYIDNDGDGRIDEEALNGVDDDGDGRIDEDLLPYDWKGYDANWRNEQRGDQLSLGWTHTLNANTFYEFRVGYFETFSGSLPKIGKDGRSRASFEELDQWTRDYEAADAFIKSKIAAGETAPPIWDLIEPYRGYGTPFESFTDQNGNQKWDAGEPYVDWNGNGFYDLNNDPDRVNANQNWFLEGANHPFRGQQINGNYWVNDRAGFNKRNTQIWTGKLDFTSQVNLNHQIKGGLEANFVDLENSSRQLTSPFDGRGLFPNDFRTKANWQAAYLQDKMEFKSAIVNLGMRLERFDQGNDVAVDSTDPNIPQLQEAQVKWSVLPRVGFSFPVTEKDMFFFNYGWFFQRPQLTRVYTGVNQPLTSSNSIIGNPNLDPEQTIQYEFGVRHQFGLNTLFTITGFFKDIDNLIQIRTNFDEKGLAYYTYVNDSYGTVKGLELQLLQRAGRYLTGDATYTFSVAKATHSDPRDTYDTLDIIDGVEFNSDWDRQHKIVFNVDYHYGAGQGPRLGGVHVLENFNWNLLYQVGSGLPYTPQTLTGQDLIPLTNTKRVAWEHTLDMRMRRYFDVASQRLGLIFEVRNLFNTRNEIGLDDNGIIDRYRDLIGFSNAGTSQTRNYGDASYAYRAPNPNGWQQGRQIFLGASIEF